MLILTRRQGEKIIVRHKGEELVIVVAELRRDCNTNKARLGFDAPASFSIHRQEVQKLVDAECGIETEDGTVIE